MIALNLYLMHSTTPSEPLSTTSPSHLFSEAALKKISSKYQQFQDTSSKTPELIALLLKHFCTYKHLKKEQFMELRGQQFTTAFSSGQCGCVSALRLSVNTRPWMKGTQQILGDMITLEINAQQEVIAVVTNCWQTHLWVAWLRLYNTLPTKSFLNQQTESRKRVLAQIGFDAKKKKPHQKRRKVQKKK